MDSGHDVEGNSPPTSPVQAAKRTISFSFDTDGDSAHDGPEATPSAIRRRRPPPMNTHLLSPTSSFGSSCYARMFAMRATLSRSCASGPGARSQALRTQRASRRAADEDFAAQNRKPAPPCRFDRHWEAQDTRRFRKCLLLIIRRWQQRTTGMPSPLYRCCSADSAL